jgi:transcriptional antiterminator NusG
LFSLETKLPSDQSELAAQEQVSDTTVAAGQTGVSVPAASDDDAPRKNWFVVHTYSGYENKVKANLEKRIETMEKEDKIFRVVVPIEEEMEIKDGKRKITKRKVFPGYVLVEMIMSDDSWYVVRNTPGVTGFVGSGSKPTPLQPSEVRSILRQMGVDEPRHKVAYSLGESVRVTAGPFEGFVGVIREIYPDKGKLRVFVSMFGRETPIELDFGQVEKL